MATIQKIQGKRGVSYKITVSLGYDKTGKQTRFYKTWRPSPRMTERNAEKEAQRQAWKFEEDIREGYRITEKQSVEDFCEYYLDLMRIKGDRPQTLGRIKRELDRFCKLFGHLQISKVKPCHITEFIKECESLGARKWNISAKPIKDFNDLKSFRNYAEFAKVLGIDARIVHRLCDGCNVSVETSQKIEKALHRSDLFEIQGASAPLASGTICNNITTLWSMFEQARKEMLIKNNPVESIPRPKKKPTREVRAIEPQELKDILKCADMERQDFRAKIYILAYTGCRKGEMLALKWEDIDLDNKIMSINKAIAYTPQEGFMLGDTKTGEHREVPLPDKLVKVLKEYKIYCGWCGTLLEDGFIFHDTRGNFYRPTSLNIAVTQFQKKYNFGRLTPHIFRHSCASLLLAEGVDPVTVAEMLGHKVETLLETYAHSIKEHQRDTSDTMERLLNDKIVNI